jgi:hypothetical protein
VAWSSLHVLENIGFTNAIWQTKVTDWEHHPEACRLSGCMWKHSLIIEDDAPDYGINPQEITRKINLNTQGISNPHFIIFFSTLFGSSFSDSPFKINYISLLERCGSLKSSPLSLLLFLASFPLLPLALTLETYFGRYFLFSTYSATQF